MQLLALVMAATTGCLLSCASDAGPAPRSVRFLTKLHYFRIRDFEYVQPSPFQAPSD
jgi:hypothetical protein